MPKTVGFFGGSFDPIHFGHISLAIDLMERYHLDEVLFCPVYCSPFKLETPPIANPDQRLELLKRALADLPQCKICDWELKRAVPSFTIDTIRALSQQPVQLRLLLSEEVASHLDRWKEKEDLLRLAPPLIGKRQVPISSTEIRSRLKKKLYCGHLVPAKALEYILEHQLYVEKIAPN